MIIWSNQLTSLSEIGRDVLFIYDGKNMNAPLLAKEQSRALSFSLSFSSHWQWLLKLRPKKDVSLWLSSLQFVVYQVLQCHCTGSFAFGKWVIATTAGAGIADCGCCAEKNKVDVSWPDKTGQLWQSGLTNLISSSHLGLKPWHTDLSWLILNVLWWWGFRAHAEDATACLCWWIPLPALHNRQGSPPRCIQNLLHNPAFNFALCTCQYSIRKTIAQTFQQN